MVATLARWLSLILPASAGKVADKPAPCRWCGGRAGVEHITEDPPPSKEVVFADLLWVISTKAPPPRRYAQVICRTCDARGPRVLFLAGDEWPHIAAEFEATAQWNRLHYKG